ncbi:MAG: radical SAM protein [Candidatus Electronema sp. VV]
MIIDRVHELLRRSQDGEVLRGEELIFLLGLPLDAAETYLVMAEAARISKELNGGRAEIHAQFAVNLAPCACNCLFCSFAEKNGIFNTASEISPEQAAAHARQFEAEGANSIYMMATAQYSLERFLETAGEVRKNLRPETVLIANVGDQTLKNAVKIKEAGFAGVYHALRLREGQDTGLAPDKRRQSIRNFQEAGLIVGTCVEPVGPEHSNEELAAMIEFTASINPAFSGAARRISISGTEMAGRGMISELRMAQIAAVTRLGMPRSVAGNCTHEPCTLGAIAGANLFWAEVGANPRDTEAKTEEGRGETVASCATIFRESGWDVWAGPSRWFRAAD